MPSVRSCNGASQKSGTNYESLEKERICRPLKMGGTWFTPELRDRQSLPEPPARTSNQNVDNLPKIW